MERRRGFQWIGTCDVDMNDLIAGGIEAKPTKRTEAMELIRKILKDGDKPSNEIYREIEKQGISRRTAEAAKRGMDITAYRKNRAWYWRLEEEASNGR